MASLVGVPKNSDGKVRKLDTNGNDPLLASIDAVNQEMLDNIVYLNNVNFGQYAKLVQWANSNDTQWFFPGEVNEPIEAAVGANIPVRVCIGDGDGTKNLLNDVSTVDVSVDGDASIVGGGTTFTVTEGEFTINVTKPTAGVVKVTLGGGNTTSNISKQAVLDLEFA